MSCPYSYLDIFNAYGGKVTEILLNNSLEGKPYPIYASRNEYDNDTTNDFKGLLVFNATKYYAGFIGADTTSGVYDETVGFYVIPEYGETQIRRNIEYQQVITYTFDSNSELDYDPYQEKIIREIDWFVNAHRTIIDEVNFTLPTGITLYGSVDHISKPIYVPENTTYVRRTVVVVLRYCMCS
jgi:hypothetical protein